MPILYLGFIARALSYNAMASLLWGSCSIANLSIFKELIMFKVIGRNLSKLGESAIKSINNTFPDIIVPNSRVR
jgi:hypothetical protein